MIALTSVNKDNGLLLRAVVEGKFQEAPIAHVTKSDLEEVTELLTLVRSMGEKEFEMTLSAIKNTSIYGEK